MNHDNDIKTAAFYFGPVVNGRMGRCSCKLMQQSIIVDSKISLVFQGLISFKNISSKAFYITT